MKLSIYQLKPQFQSLLAPLLASLQRWRITPNQITLFAMSLSLMLGMALAVVPPDSSAARALWIAFPFFMLLRMALNAIDGMLANLTGNKTALGALLNELCDQVSDAALYLPFALIAGVNGALVVIVVIAALLAEFAGVLAFSIGQARRFDGPMGKSDRALVFAVVALLVIVGVNPMWINGLIGLTLVLALWTIFNRVRQALRPINQSAPPKP